VYGSKGIYELVYFVKESKSLDRFKKAALESDKLIENKGVEEIEKLVSTFIDFYFINQNYLPFVCLFIPF
jgi:DNA polymerase sigma